MIYMNISPTSPTRYLKVYKLEKICKQRYEYMIKNNENHLYNLRTIIFRLKHSPSYLFEI